MLDEEYLDVEQERYEGRRRLVFVAAMLFLIILMIVVHQGFLVPGGVLLGRKRLILTNPASQGLPYNPLRIPMDDRGEISAWYIPRPDESRKNDPQSFWDWFGTGEPATQQPGGTVLLLGDGLRDKSSLLPEARLLNRLGYTVYLFDYRGCGDSTGKASIENALEDTLSMYQETRRRYPEDRYALYGLGLGANLALEAARRLEHRSAQSIQALVLDTPVPSLQQFRQEQLEKKYGRMLASLILRYRPMSTTVRPAREAAEELAAVPMMFLHGELDGTSLPATVALYNCKKGIRELWVSPDCRMGEAPIQFPLETAAQLGKFLDPLLLNRASSERSLTPEIRQTPSGEKVAGFEIPPALFQGRSREDPLALQVCLLSQAGPSVQRFWIGAEQRSIHVPLEPTTFWALAWPLKYVEPLETPASDIPQVPILSRAQDERQYQYRQADLKAERARLTELYEYLRKKWEGDTASSRYTRLVQARQHLGAGRLGKARETLLAFLNEEKPLATFDAANPGSSGGIRPVKEPSGSGAMQVVRTRGRSAVKTEVRNQQDRLTFDVEDQLLLNARPGLIGIEVEYLDTGRDLFCLTYDSHDPHAPAHHGDQKPTRMAAKTGTGEWKRTLFLMSDARLANRGPAGGDLSLCAVDSVAYPQDETISQLRLFVFSP